MDGVLVVDKPSGPTSHDVVAAARRLLGTARIGHTGTLDPLASGVLPLVVGRATRLARFLSAGPKAYRATVKLGVATDTHDALGQAVAGAGVSGPVPAPAVVAEVAASFRGAILQVPPAFSAKKVGGVRAYALARRQQPVGLAPVAVHVYRLEIDDMGPDVVSLSLLCSGGFYVRALARDLGIALGCGAHLTRLRRTRSGEFDERDALALDALERDPPGPARALVPLSSLLPGLPTAALTPAAAARVAHGGQAGEDDVASWRDARPPEAGDPSHDARDGIDGDHGEALVRLTDAGGRLLGVGRRVAAQPPSGPARPAGRWILQPVVVLV
jgi:tRNA pseudouridine55 synthase